MMKMMAIKNELHTQRHHIVGIVEDGLCVVEIDQVVVLYVAGQSGGAASD